VIFLLLLSTIHFSGNEKFEYLILDRNEDYIENTFFINIRQKPFAIYLKSLLFLPPKTDEYKFILWKRFNGKFDFLELNLGNYYATYLDGLLLRAYNDIAYKRDKSLFGLHLSLKAGIFNISGFTGRPRNILYENYDYHIINDTTNTLTGINTEFRVRKQRFEFGYLRMRDRGDIYPTTFTELYGAGMELKFDISDMFLYYIHKGGARPYLGTAYDGDGFAGGLSFYLHPVGLQFYYSYYDSIALGSGLYRYNDPRPLNRSEISINRGEDERGFSAILDFSPGPYYIEAHLSNIRTFDIRKRVEDHYVKLEIPLHGFNKITLDYEYILKRNFEPYVDLKVENTPRIIYEVSIEEVGLRALGGITVIEADTFKYTEGNLEVSLSYNRFSVTGSYIRRSKKILYLEENVRWRKLETMMEAPDNLILRMMIGEEMGGLVCSGGVCRFESPFRGVKFLLEKRF